MYFQYMKVADVNSVGETILKPKSQSTMSLQVELLQFSSSDLTNIGIELVKVFAGTKEALFQIGGEIKVQASIYERLTIPYLITVKGSEIVEDVSNDCK